MTNIQEILNQIDVILEYFIPGFFFLLTYQFLMSKKLKNVAYFTITSVATSYIIKNALILLHLYIMKSYSFTIAGKVLIECAFAIAVSFIFVKVLNIRFINKALNWLCNKSIHEDIWRDIIDYDLGTTLMVFTADEIIIGKLLAHEEKGNDSWFVLSDYTIKNNIKKTKVKSKAYTNCKTIVAINIKDVSKIELFYNNGTKMLD